MSILCVGDPHFRSKDVDVQQELHTIVMEKIHMLQLLFVVVLGDLIDTQHAGILEHSRAIDFIVAISTKCRVYLIVGNHDMPDSNNFCTKNHYYHALDRQQNIVVVDSPTMAIEDSNYYAFCPYVPPGRLLEALECIQPIQKYRCIFAHQEIQGASMGSGISIIGDVWKEGYPLLVSGHIHEYQWVHHNMVYVGTPYQVHSSESTNKALLYITPTHIERHMLYLTNKIHTRKIYKQTYHLKKHTTYLETLRASLSKEAIDTLDKIVWKIQHPQ